MVNEEAQHFYGQKRVGCLRAPVEELWSNTCFSLPFTAEV